MLTPAALEAHKRFAADWNRSQLNLRVTMDWSLGVPRDRNTHGGRLGSNEASLGARDRIKAALDHLGEAMAGLVVDLCGLQKGLEVIERERGWPQRSGKIAAMLALEHLSRHYRLGETAVGPRSTQSRFWHDPASRAEANLTGSDRPL